LKPPRSAARRWATRVGLALAALLLLVGLALVAARVYLSSAGGQANVSAQVAGGINSAIAGRVEVGQVQLSGLEVVLRGWKLYDPEGNLVAEVDEVRATPRLAALTAGRVDLSVAQVDNPRLYLVQDERGLNLLRALELKARPVAGVPAKPSAFLLNVAQLSVRGGAVDFTLRAPNEPDRRYSVEALTAKGAGRYSAANNAVEARVELGGQATSPLKAPLTLTATVQGEGQTLSGQASASLGKAKAVVRASQSGTEALALFVDSAELPPDVTAAFVPKWPLRPTLVAHGSFEQQGKVAKVALTAAAGASQVSAAASVDLARWRADGLKVSARRVNLEELVEGALPSDLSLELTGRASGTSLETLDAQVTLDVPQGQLAGERVGPAHVEASAQEGTVQLTALRAALPGLAVTGEGEGTLAAIHLKGRLEATDLQALARAAAAVGVDGLPKTSGSGAFDFQVDGAPTHPGVSVSGGLASLRLDSFEVKAATLTAKLPDVRRPLEAEGQLTAASLSVGAQTFEAVSAKLTTRGRELEADLSAKGLADLVVHAIGTVDADSQGIAFTTFDLQYPEARWAMQSPSAVAWRNDTVVVQPLTLTSGEQRLALSGQLRGQQVRASVDAASVDLAKLPRALVDPKLGLKGLVTASAKVQGTLSHPTGEGRLALSAGALGKLTGVDATLEGSYRLDRATGKLKVASKLGALDGDFDVPVEALVNRRPEPLRVALELRALHLAEALTAFDVQVPADGTVSGTALLDGSAFAPKLSLVLEGQQLSLARPPALPLAAKRALLKVAVGEGDRVGAKLEVSALGGEATLMVDTPFTVAGLLERFPSAGELLDTLLGAELDARQLSLAQLSSLGFLPEGVAGQLALSASAKGTAHSPEGAARVTVSGLTAPGVPATEVTWQVKAGAAQVDTELEATRKGQGVAALKAKLGAGLTAVFTLASLGRAPLEATAALGPIVFSETLPAGLDEQLTASSLAGTAEGHLSLTGSLDAPRLGAQATATQLRLGKTPVGKAQLDYEYAAGKSALTALFDAPNGSALNAKAEASLALSLASVLHGLDWKAAGFDLKVKADRFELGILSGLLPAVRTLAGKLTADGEASGTLGAPAVRGTVELTDGRLGLWGYGEYRKLHLVAEASADHFAVKEFTASSGGGTARFTAEGTRVGEAFQVTGAVDSAKFPIIFDDQLFAAATLRATFEGDLSSRRLDVSRLSIPEARVELPQVKRKDLQALERPVDVVLVKAGKPLTPAHEKPAKPLGPVRQEPGFQAVVVVDAPRNLWVKGSDVNVELGLSEGFRLELGQALQLFGEVHVLRGKADVIGRRFDVMKDSQVRFAGAAASPYINLTANYSSEREGVLVSVAISGRGKDLTLKPTSQPPMSESEIYTLLATGRRTLKRDSGATITGAQAASVLGSLAASQLRNVIAQKVPLDVFTVEAGEEGLAGTRVEAGTYLSDKAYLGYAGELGADPMKGENSHEVRFEYQISPRWSFEAKFGDAKAGGADLIWSKDY
jgi:translocation and assembly module TamB